MLTSTDEINLHRLLLSCERKLNLDPIDAWTASEKRKFATYVKYLAILQTKLKPTNQIVNYASRIDKLTRAVAVHTMHVDVEKGVAEARLVKKKHLEELKQLEETDPDWLLELKRQDGQVLLEEAARKQKLLQDDTEEEGYEKYEEKEEDEEEEEEQNEQKEKKSSGSEIRQRNNKNENMLDSSNIEHVLQHHRQMHDELTTDLSKMAKQLKINSQSFGDTLAKDDIILKEAHETVESNLARMKTERQRLDEHYSKSWGTSFMSMTVILFVCIMFVLVFFTIRFLPKA